MDFDFQSYLAPLLSLPPHQINIEILTGGYCNVTARATFFPPADLSKFGLSQKVDSIVLKYAPPFMATDPSQMLHIHRQVVEARALDLLSPHSEAPLPVSSLLTKFPPVKIPRLVHHDIGHRVLSMTDLGQSAQTLDDWLACEPGPPGQEVERIATVLGQFLADFAVGTRDPTAETLARASNLELMDGYYADMVDITRSVLTRAGVADADALVMRVDQSLREIGKVEPCLGMVDLWAGNILIDPHGSCGLIDWEYFGLSSASCELSMLVASLQLILLRTKSSKETVNRTRTFITTLLRNYGLRAPAPSLHFKRQAIIAQGRAILNTLGFYEAEFDDDMKRRALDAGIRSLRAAGESEQELDLSFFDETMSDYESLYASVGAILTAR